MWPGFSLEQFGILGDRRVCENGDEIVVSMPLAGRLEATVETGFQVMGRGINLRMRQTTDGWQYVGLEPGAE